ncbi:HU family DNA-binding protein [Thermocrinis minervae]|uniref:Integration host factor subunit alpha n=1 Tax=Thermocrinis minervae TaxID=381751 RepID=A0A1M6Q7B7_9AQUI|nr:HU family DNA-binding protein [Thermocrinis minervae]SHK16007.1 integration host factor subunit alpha [Thermocrinis minervae]
MTKDLLASKLFQKLQGKNISKRKAKKIVRAIFEEIKGGLLKDGVVKISSFGTFRLKSYKAKTVKLPTEGKQVYIPPKEKVTFIPSKKLIGRLNIGVKKVKI